ncbi:MAG TPA: ABC transporter permease [Acidimicrobiia bacterium]|nr:ABC transporter permease [Acidimicrobiia bacterium]
MGAEPNSHLDADLRGLDALDTPLVDAAGRAQRLWSAVWPKLLAVAIVLAGWQAVVWSGWRPYVIKPPATVISELGSIMTTARFYEAVSITMQRAALGFLLATVVGSAIGMAVSQSELLRRAIGSIITGLQSMPSIAWFPFAIMMFGLTETAILSVIVLGAAPAIANGLISGVDHIPPILLRVGNVLGARGVAAWRHVVLPAALPAFVSGLKQGWAFAWRSLMAGELLVMIASRPSIGVRLHTAREQADASGLMAMMIVVLLIGILVDSLVFGSAERRIRRNRGLLGGGAKAAIR